MVDLILSMADSENLKIFSLSGGLGMGFTSSMWGVAGVPEGRVRSSFTRVFRALVRSKKGGADVEGAPRHVSAHELMKCHVDVPSKIA